MAKHDAVWWAARVAELAEGADGSAIAARHGVSIQLLKWWRWRLGTEAPRKPATPRPSARRPAALREQRLLPVVVATEPQTPLVDGRADDATTIIETSRGRIAMRGSLSPEQLAAVVAELVRGC